MYLAALSRYLCALTLCIYFAQANWIEINNIFARQPLDEQVEEKQIDTVIAAVSSPTTTSVPLSTGAAAPATTTTSDPPSTADSKTTSANPIQKSTSTSTQRPNPPTSSIANPNPSPTSVNSQDPPANTDNTDTSTTIIPASSVSQSVELVTTIVTVSGSAVTSVSESTAITTVPASGPTGKSSPKDGIADKSDSKSKNTIIGVSVGVGGTILLATMAAIGWRIWGRKRRSEQVSGLDFRTISPGQEKPGGINNMRPTNPFQSTLETYHNPTRVNASSNF
ncbi:unnamed protein product [Blumeria hordei]|uniref:Mid2 domain-containing protein n=1 Tax=Blumeria hordei TaxID=2867405 RepID=A0A383UYC5_BLUHO|nr:unnamed protein product [Blumeria hordei]